MPYKSALAGLNLGGGKAVIVGDSRRDKTPELWRAKGVLIDTLGGLYITTEDSGTTVEDMQTMVERTRWVDGVKTDK